MPGLERAETFTVSVHRPLLTSVTVGFWCLTSGWLLASKVLPSLHPGSPPSQQTLYTAGNRLEPVGWTVKWNDRPVGWALTETHRAAPGGLTVDSRLHFDRLPLDEMLPPWVRLLVQRAVSAGPGTSFDARGRLMIDAGGELRAFTSIVSLPGTAEQIVLNGTVDDGQMHVTIRAGEMRHETTRSFPRHIMIGDELSPQATLPGLYEGRRWTVPVYSPLRPRHTPIEILHAVVGGEESVFWNDSLVRTHIVSYHEEPSGHHEPRCRMWVDLSGRVLRQEALLLGARLSFLRRTDADAAHLAASIGQAAPPGSPAPTITEATP